VKRGRIEVANDRILWQVYLWLSEVSSIGLENPAQPTEFWMWNRIPLTFIQRAVFKSF